MSFAFTSSVAPAVAAKRANVAGLRAKTSGNNPRTVKSSRVRAAVDSDKGAAIKPFEVRESPKALRLRASPRDPREFRRFRAPSSPRSPPPRTSLRRLWILPPNDYQCSRAIAILGESEETGGI